MKPETQFGFADAEVVAATVAHFTKIRKQMLADQPQLEDVIKSRLAWGVLRRLEAQVIGGNGTGQNLLGILGHDIGEVDFDADELPADQVLAGVADVLNADAEPDFVAVSIRDWVTMLKGKAEGSGEYYSGGPFAVTAERLWGTVTVPSRALADGTALVGDSRQLTVYVREGVNVLASDSDQDDFVRNRLTLLGEGRFGLALWQPSAFTLVRLARVMACRQRATCPPLTPRTAGSLLR